MNQPSMRRFVSCGEDKTPSLGDDEIVTYTLKNIGVAFRSEDEILEKVDLFVTSSRILIIGETLAFDFDVSYVTLHAITRDPASYSSPCVYCQLDFEEDNDDDDEEEITPLKYPKVEMFLVPGDESLLMEIFNAFSEAALMNPDPPEDGEEEGDDELIYNTEEVALGVEQTRALEHLESVFHLPGDDSADIEDQSHIYDDAPEK